MKFNTIAKATTFLDLAAKQGIGCEEGEEDGKQQNKIGKEFESIANNQRDTSYDFKGDHCNGEK